MTRILLLAVSATALSGCSWLGLGGHSSSGYDQYAYDQYGAAGTYQAPVAKPCCNGARLSKWNVEGGIGPSFIVGGDAVTGNDTNEGSGAAIPELDMDDLFDDGYRAELGVSKALNPYRKLTATGHFVEHDSKGAVDRGTIDGASLTGGLSDYRAYGGELGLRQYGRILPAPLVRSVRPYVEGRVGASYVEDIDIVGANLGGADLDAIPFYDGGWAATGAGLVGVETPFIGNSTIGLETGIRYTAKIDSDTSVAGAGNPLGGTNNGSDKWSVPVMLRGRYRF